MHGEANVFEQEVRGAAKQQAFQHYNNKKESKELQAVHSGLLAAFRFLLRLVSTSSSTMSIT
jgi:hypothetical protein